MPRACFIQLLALALVILPRLAAPAWGATLPWMTWPALQGALALAIAWALGEPWWWRWVHALFLPALLGAQALGLPPWAALLVFAILLLVYWRTDNSQVPLYLSNATTAEAVAGLLGPADHHVVDLGCGLAGLLRVVARRHPYVRCTGVEHAPLTCFFAWALSLHSPNVRVRWGSLWRVPLADADLVYAFLSPVPMPELWRKACDEMPAGARLISNSFEIPGVKPARVITLGDARATRLLCYVIPPRAGQAKA